MTTKTMLRPGLMTRLLLIVALALALIGAPAGAQDTETEEPPADTTVDDGLDFGDNVVVDEDGTVRWNVDAENDAAEVDPGAPTPVPESGVEGTGSLEDERPAVAPPEPQSSGGPGGELPASDPLDRSNAAGSGSRTAMLLGVGAAVLALVVAITFFVRNKRAKAAAAPQVEVVLDEPTGLPTLPDSHGDPSRAYAGAADAGAYERGGAAYAQYTEPPLEAPDEDVATTIIAKSDSGNGPRNKLDQLRLQMSQLADKKLADSGQDRLVAQKLEAAGSQMRPGEWLVMTLAGITGALFIGTFLLGWLIGVIAAVLVALGFWMFLTVQETKRRRDFAEALPETLQLIAGSLRGGLSMMQAIQTVADEADEPTAGEFQRVVTETRLGRDLAVSFRDMARRMDSKDFEWVVTAIEIHRDVGGDLANILDRVGDTIRARNRVRGQVKALSAEGRMSGLVLFLLPPVMVGAIAVLNREYLNEMLNATEGQIMLVISIVLLLIGGAWLKRLARFVY